MSTTECILQICIRIVNFWILGYIVCFHKSRETQNGKGRVYTLLLRTTWAAKGCDGGGGGSGFGVAGPTAMT